MPAFPAKSRRIDRGDSPNERQRPAPRRPTGSSEERNCRGALFGRGFYECTRRPSQAVKDRRFCRRGLLSLSKLVEDKSREQQDGKQDREGELRPEFSPSLTDDQGSKLLRFQFCRHHFVLKLPFPIIGPVMKPMQRRSP